MGPAQHPHSMSAAGCRLQGLMLTQRSTCPASAVQLNCSSSATGLPQRQTQCWPSGRNRTCPQQQPLTGYQPWLVSSDCRSLSSESCPIGCLTNRSRRPHPECWPAAVSLLPYLACVPWRTACMTCFVAGIFCDYTAPPTSLLTGESSCCRSVLDAFGCY